MVKVTVIFNPYNIFCVNRSIPRPQSLLPDKNGKLFMYQQYAGTLLDQRTYICNKMIMILVVMPFNVFVTMLPVNLISFQFYAN